MKVSIIKNPKSGIKNLRKQVAPESLVNRKDESLFWGDDDGEPLRLIGTIQRSPAGIRCFRKLIEYTYGDGFQSEKLSAEMANPEQTFDNILRESCSPLWKLGGFSWCIKWELDDNLNPRISKLYSIPFESVRLGVPDENGDVNEFIYNPYFGTSEYQKKYNEIYYDFNPDPTEISKQIKQADEAGEPYRGQILWIANNSEFARFYPRPDWSGDNLNDGGGFQAMENDFLLTRLLGRDLGQGFLQNNIIKMVGDPDQPIEKHAERAAEGKSFTSVGTEFESYLDEKFQGIDGDAILVLWARISEEFPEIQAFPTNFNYDKLKDVAEKVEKTVVATMGVPPIMAGIESSGSISKDDIMSASYLMYSIVRYNQSIISEAFKKILPYWHNSFLIAEGCGIENFRPFPEEKTIDPLIWAELTSEERRGWIKENTSFDLMEVEAVIPGAPIVNKFAKETIENIPPGQWFDIFQIIKRFESGDITYQQAKIILEESYGFDQKTLKAWLGVANITPTKEEENIFNSGLGYNRNTTPTPIKEL